MKKKSIKKTAKQVLKPELKKGMKDGFSPTLADTLLLLDLRNAELSLINSVQQAIMAEMDLQGIYDLVGDKIRDLFNAQVVGIHTIDSEKNMEYFNYMYEDGERLFQKPRALDKIRLLLVKKKELILIDENLAQNVAEISGVPAKPVPGSKLPKSILFVPMVVRGQVRGYVSLQNLDSEHAFSESEVQLLSTLTNSMSSALENARLFNETEQRNAELAVINSVQQGLAAEMDMQGIYNLVGDRLRELFDAQVTGIYSFDHDSGMEHFNYLFEDGQRLYPESRPFNDIRNWIIKNKSLLLVNKDADNDIYKISNKINSVVPGTRLPKSMLFVPLIVGKEVKGCVSLQNLDRENAFSDADVRLLSTLANSMSVALENARLFNETEQRNAELAVINSVQEGLVAEMDIQGIYDLVGNKIRDLFNSQVAIIATFDHENHKESFNYFFEDGKRFYPEPRRFDNIRQRLIETQKLIHIKENAIRACEEFGVDSEAVPGTIFPKTMLYVPLIIGDAVRGYVSLQNLDKEHAFSDSDVRLLSTLANSMSVALENARLFNETEQRNAELAVINSVQEGLVAEMDMQGIYDLVGDKIRDLFDSQVTSMCTFNYEHNTEEFKYMFEDGERFILEPRPIDKVRQRLIDTKELICINENADEEWTKITGEEPTVIPGTKLTKSVLFVPMLVGNEVRGYVSLQNVDKEHAFSNSDMRLLSTLANSMSVALENARLFNETEQRNAELAVINSVQEGLVAEMDIQGIYDLVGDKTRELFNSQVTIIATFDHENHKELFNYLFEDGKRFYPEPRTFDNIRKHLIKTQKLIHVQENATEEFEKLGVILKAVPGTKNAKTMLYVPLIIGDTVRGYVSLQNLDKENAFSDADVRLLSTLANSMSVALENARLFNETEQRNAELAVINSVQEGLVAEMDIQGIYDLVGDKTKELFNSQVTIIASFDHETHKELFNYFFEDGKRFYPEPRIFDIIRQRLIETQKLIHIQENAAKAFEEFGIGFEAVPGTKLPKTMLYVPLIIGDTVRGYVSLQNLDKENAFSDSDVSLLSTLANSMSVALENARLFNETEQRNAELAVINSVQRGLVAEMDMQGIYDLVGDKIRDLFDSQAAIIATFNHENKTETFQYIYEKGERVYSQSRPFDEIRQRLISTQKLINISENAEQAVATITGKPPTAVPGTVFPKSMLYVPLVLGDEVRGYVSLQNLDKEHAFSNSDVRLLSTLANSMSVALENARLFNETEQRNAELAIINNVQQGLVAEMDMQGIYDLMGSRICEVLNTQALLIRTFDHSAGLEIWEYAIENGERLFSEPRPFIWANQHLITTKESLLINENYLKTAKQYGEQNKGVSKGLPPKSAIFVPMIVGDIVMGSVSLQNVEKENAFTESDVRLLSTLTNSMSVALQNARLFNETTRLLAETEQRATELQTVNNISRAMVSLLEFDALIELVGEQMRETFKADIVYLALYDRKTNMLHFPYSYGETTESRPFSNGFTEKIILNQEPLLINHMMDQADAKINFKLKGVMVQSYLGVPIIVGSKSIGVISVQSTEAKNRFDEYDQRLLTTIAANLGIAIQNAEAYQKLQAALTELRAAQEQLIQSEKMASLGELTAGIAHEIQNPLNFVNNFSEVSEELLEELAGEIKSNSVSAIEEIIADLKQNLNKINHHGKRASSIVKGMLDHSRTSNGIMVLTDINVLADEYLRLSYHGLRAKDRSFNADFKTDLDPTLPKVTVVPQDFGRVILNLINNAFYAVRKKAMESKEGYQPTVTVLTRKIEDAIEISVKDNGEGISKDIADKIFQPFFTTKPSGEGTGLGLSLAYDIVTKGHGGKLTVDSKKGIYTEFTIVLPIKK